MKQTKRQHTISFFRQWGSLLILLFSINMVQAQLAFWNPVGQSGFGTSPFMPSTTNANLTVSGIARGAGVTTSGSAASNAWGGNGWTDQPTDDFTWTMTANAGYEQSFSSLALQYRRSGTGPNSAALQYSIDGGSYTSITTLSFSSTSSSGASHPTVDLSGIVGLQNVPAGSVVGFRIAFCLCICSVNNQMRTKIR